MSIPPPLAPEAFLATLDAVIAGALERIGKEGAAATPGPDIGVPELLATALKKELEASEEAAIWMARETDVDVKLALARQCGDEAKHYKLIEERLRALGVDTTKLDPQAGGPTPMFKFLESLETTVERIAAGPFTREALAGVHNRLFIEFCKEANDHVTARLYRDVIQPDEEHHHGLGRRLLARLAVTGEQQDKARHAARRTLEIGAELQEVARLKRGIAHSPGC